MSLNNTQSSDKEPGRAIAAFHLHLQCPVLTLFLNIAYKTSWLGIKAEFLDKYCNLTKLNNDPRYILESAAFHQLSLGSTHPTEEFHSIIFDKGHMLGKSECDLIFPNSFKDFRTSYHLSFAPDKYLHSEKYLIRKRLVRLMVIALTPPLIMLDPVKPPRNDQPRDRSRGIKRTCYSYQAPAHTKSACNWTGVGSITHVKCQLCFQFGHVAQNCKTLTSSNDPSQLCNSSGYTARD